MQFESTELPGNITRLSLTGRLDMDGTQAIEQKFTFQTTTRAGKYVVDLSGVSFLASIGIRMLITSARGQSGRGGKVVLAAPQPLVRNVLETAGIDKLVPMVDSVEAAQTTLA
jgi:anti-sigma B factor antagonist